MLGLFRLWIVCTGAWIALMMVGGGVELTAEHVVTLMTPPLVVLVAVAAFTWAIRGFR